MKMYWFRQSTYTLSIFLGLATLIFILFTVLPGDPARMMLDQREDSEQMDALRSKYGFDLPYYQQYAWYINDLSPISFHKNQTGHISDPGERSILFSIIKKKNWQIAVKWPYLRTSFQQEGKKVSSIIAEVLPNTIVLAFAAMTLALTGGILLGVIGALQVNSFIDRLITVISTLGMAVPSFFSSIVIAWLFGYLWSQYTHLPMTGSLYEWDDMGEGRHIAWRNLILPAFTLGIRPLAVITQLARSSMLEVWSQDYIRTARAKGLTEKYIVWYHALPNALNPVITSASGWLASMLAGAVFVEYIFGWNGLGKRIVEALNTLDLPVIMGCVLTIAFFFIIINFVVDKLYAKLDPRIQKT